MNQYKELLILFIFAIIGVSSRILHHVPNFTPIVGLALFISYQWKPKHSIFFVLSTMFISDLVIGYDSIQMRILVYSSLILPSFLGVLIRNPKTFEHKYFHIFGYSMASSVFFYIVTNFGVWLWSGMYEHTVEGLLFCYTMALPFFKNTILGDLFSSFLIFSITDLISLYQKKLASSNLDQIK